MTTGSQTTSILVSISKKLSLSTMRATLNSIQSFTMVCKHQTTLTTRPWREKYTLLNTMRRGMMLTGEGKNTEISTRTHINSFHTSTTMFMMRTSAGIIATNLTITLPTTILIRCTSITLELTMKRHTSSMKAMKLHITRYTL